MTTNTLVDATPNPSLPAPPEPPLRWDDKLMLGFLAIAVLAVALFTVRAIIFSGSPESTLTSTLRAQPRGSLTGLEAANSWWKADKYEQAALGADGKTSTWHVVGTLPTSADVPLTTYATYLDAFRDKKLFMVEQRVQAPSAITPEVYPDVFKARLESAQCNCSVVHNNIRVEPLKVGPLYQDDSPQEVYRDGMGAFDFLNGTLPLFLGLAALVTGLAMGIAKRSPSAPVAGALLASFFWFALQPLANFTWYWTMQRTWPL
jgi:hypothetical protein